MPRFNDISLRGKLIINFLVSGGVLIAAILFCLYQLRLVGADTREITANWLPSIQQAGEISQLRLRYRVRSLEYMLEPEEEGRAKIGKSLASLDASLHEALKKYEPLISSDEERKVYDELVKTVDAYRATVSDAIAKMNEGQIFDAHEMRRSSWVKAADAVRDATDALLKINRAGAEAASADAAHGESAALRGGLSALVAGVVIALIATFLLARSLSRRLSDSVAAAQVIAGGDLTGRMPAASQDEIGKLIAAMTEMQKALRSALQETQASSQALLECSGHLNESVRQMDESAHVQSSVASAIAANVEEVTVSINHVSDNTSEAAHFALDSDRMAKEGHDQIDQLVERIGEVANVVRSSADQIAKLEGESEKISNIVSVIKDIADQTNLLALNAAIEAARAGEQGRGFAVVADEVRKLSERTAVSTGEIGKMVDAIQVSTREVVAQVGNGVKMVDEGVTNARQAGETIGGLQDMAKKVSQLVAAVDEALREQASASNDVAKKVEDVAAQAEEATAIAKQTSNAADSLTQTAHAMEQLVARFRI
jgi:methyl-accepting chemotaxis protein